MIVSFTDATLATGGGKAANLGELLRAGFPVPDGFVIDADTYRQVTSGLDIPTLLTGGADALRTAVQSRTLPPDLVRQVTERLDAWGHDVPVAVRSSATAEDLPDASFAGQQDTFLGVVGPDAVLDAIRRCWGSLWTARAVDYRRRNGFDHADVALAVVVQRLVDADTAGVLFTSNPVTGADECLINASWGLGESVVSGTVTPDEFRATGTTVLERTPGAKQTRIDRDGTSTRTTAVTPTNQRRLCLVDAQVLRLAQLGDAVHQHFAIPMDIEWAFEGQQLWLLQARPITTAPTHGYDAGSRAQMDSAPDAGTTPSTSPQPSSGTPTRTVTGRRIGKVSRTFHTDLVEHYPGPYPLDLAAVIPMHRQLQAGMASIGITSTPIEQLITLDDGGTITAGYPDVHLGWRIGRLLNYPAPDPAGWPAVEHQYRDQLASALPADLTPVSDADLFTLLDDVLAIVSDISRTRFLDYVGPAQLTAARLNGYLKLARRPDLDAYSLLGDLDYTTVVIDRSLHDLARLDPHSLEHTRARDRFLEQHGARTTKLYLPFSHRSWREDPTALDATLDAIRRAGTSATTHTGASHDELVAQISARLPAPARRGFTQTLATWRAGHLAREASVYLIEEAYVSARRVVDTLAHRLHEHSALAEPQQIMYLTLDEVRATLLGQATPRHTRDIVDRRAAVRPRAATAWWATDPTQAEGQLTGAAGSPGIASGPVRVITGPEDFDTLQPGEVLVCHYTDPSWTPLFSLAAAVVADTGGRLSHAAIVAREYRIPAVMGTAGATSTLTPGQIVTVNGTTGAVTPQGQAPTHDRSRPSAARP